jgi:hypothetical protein
MSDELISQATVVPVHRRTVMRLDGLYRIALFTDEAGWIVDGRGFPHSTSAYAKLGRIVNQEMNQQ